MTTTTYAADRTALLIVDPYNDFMSEGGRLYEATNQQGRARTAQRDIFQAVRGGRGGAQSGHWASG
jgi:nicotinamidase-related amidase